MPQNELNKNELNINDRIERAELLLEALGQRRPSIGRTEFQSAPGPVPSVWVDCSACRGTGTRRFIKCSECKGRGLVLVDPYIHEKPDATAPTVQPENRETMSSHEIDRVLEVLAQTQAEREGRLELLTGREDREIAMLACYFCKGKKCNRCQDTGLSAWGELQRALFIMDQQLPELRRVIEVCFFGDMPRDHWLKWFAMVRLVDIMRGPIHLPGWLEKTIADKRSYDVKEVYAQTKSLTKTAKIMKMDRRHIKRLLGIA